jgi:deltex-like protein
VGEVVVTNGGGKLGCSYVIHAVGPDGSKYLPAECGLLVSQAIHNTLITAEKYNAASIALPAISCGIYGVSSDLVAHSIINTIKGFNYTKPAPSLSDIRIVILDEPTHSCFLRHFRQIAQPPRRVSKKSAPRGHKAHSSRKDDWKTLPAEGVMLCLDDMAWIMPLLGRIAPKWKEVLMKIGMPSDQIISMTERVKDEVILLNTGISKWLQQEQASPGVTLDALAAALSSPEVGEEQVASEIVTAGLWRKGQCTVARESSNGLTDVKYPALPEEESLSWPKSTDAASERNSPKEKECPICLEKLKSPLKTNCGHTFCKDCLEKALEYDPYCPSCKTPLREITGKQPPGGTMTHSTMAQSLPGYDGYNTIQIVYTVPSGVQGPEHPNPRQPYSGTSRTAYLPDTHEGQEVLKLFQKAFEARMIFTIGTSITSGLQNVVVWNDIHHKTSITGGP